MQIHDYELIWQVICLTFVSVAKGLCLNSDKTRITNEDFSRQTSINLFNSTIFLMFLNPRLFSPLIVHNDINKSIVNVHM